MERRARGDTCEEPPRAICSTWRPSPINAARGRLSPSVRTLRGQGLRPKMGQGILDFNISGIIGHSCSRFPGLHIGPSVEKRFTNK